jgi:hypothetical protein
LIGQSVAFIIAANETHSAGNDEPIAANDERIGGNHGFIAASQMFREASQMFREASQKISGSICFAIARNFCLPESRVVLY